MRLFNEKQVCLTRVIELRELLKDFDILGNAGEQPKEKEEAGCRAESDDDTRPTLANLLKQASPADVELTADDLRSVSEWALERLEEMGEESHWGPGAVGEGDLDR